LEKYTITSDVSGNSETREIAFCLKVINGITQTYTGVFKRKSLDCCGHEIETSLMGLNIIKDKLKKGDAVTVNTDCKNQAMGHGEFRETVRGLRRAGVYVSIDKNRKDEQYRQCHQIARAALRVRDGRCGSPDHYEYYQNSAIWKNNS
jgi:hypothetical protein